MIPAAFDYMRAKSLTDALGVLAAHDDDAKLIAGGYSLLPMMKLRFAQPAILVDINELAELKGIDIGPTEVRIGAATSHAAIEHDAKLAGALPLMATVAPL